MHLHSTSYQYAVLPNGIKLIHRQKPGEVAHLALMVNTGTRDELENENGLAHLIEHMIFKGTKKRKAFHVLSRLENIGGDLNAYTTKEETCIHASFLKPYYDRSLELFADIAFQASFPANELIKEKDVILDEINSYRDNPSEEIFDEFENQLFNGHPIGRNILGTADSVKAFKRSDIFRFVNANYATDQMVLGSVGDLPFERFVALAKRYFAAVPARTLQSKRSAFEHYTPASKSVERNSFLSHGMIGNVAYHRRHPKKHAMVLLNNILGGPGLNSRLNLNIREKYGFTYSIESHFTAYSDTGVFAIYLGTDPKSIDKAMRLVHKELKSLREKPLGSLQLHRAKQQLIGQLAISFESGLSELLSITRSHLLFDQVDGMAAISKRIEGIAAVDLSEAALEIFEPEKMNTLVFSGTGEDVAD